MDPVLMWLLIGAGLIVFEAATAPGLGLFLAGLGALTTAIIVKGGFVSITNIPAQFAWFFGLTVVWTAGLWKPFQKFRNSHGANNADSPKIQELVGSTATVGKKGLQRGEMGQVHWSGTIMSARLSDGVPEDFLPEGAQVLINSVTGTIVYVSSLSRD